MRSSLPCLDARLSVAADFGALQLVRWTAQLCAAMRLFVGRIPTALPRLPMGGMAPLFLAPPRDPTRECPSRVAFVPCAPKPRGIQGRGAQRLRAIQGRVLRSRVRSEAAVRSAACDPGPRAPKPRAIQASRASRLKRSCWAAQLRDAAASLRAAWCPARALQSREAPKAVVRNAACDPSPRALMPRDLQARALHCREVRACVICVRVCRCNLGHLLPNRAALPPRAFASLPLHERAAVLSATQAAAIFARARFLPPCTPSHSATIWAVP